MAALVSATPARAQIIAQDNFGEGTVGSEILGAGSAGNGWANSWADKNNLDQVQSGALGYTDGSGNVLASSGNSLQSNGQAAGSNSSEPERTLSQTVGQMALANTADPNTVWMSVLWQSGNASASGSNFRQATMMFLKGASTTSSSPGGTEYMDVGMPNISSANVSTVLPNLSLWASSGNAGQTTTSLAPLQSTFAINNTLTCFLLFEFTGTSTAWGAAGNAETLNVWVDPTLTGAMPLGTPSLSYSLQDLSTLNAIRFQGGGLNSTYGPLPGEETVGNLLIGNTPADVEPVAAPESGVAGLGALGGLMAIAFARLGRNRK